MPSLSVIIPTYNRCGSLLRTLNALTNQTLPYNEFEVVVVSDGSTDGTTEMISSFRSDFKLNFVKQKNQGPSVARNQGARLAQSPLLIYLDDDIEPCIEFLEEHLREQHGQLRLVVIGPQTGPMAEPMSNWVAWEHLMLQKQYDNFKSGVWEAGPNNLYSGNFSVLREHLLGVGGFNEVFTRQEDVELGFRLAERGLSFRFNANADGIHRPNRTFASWYKTPYEYGRRDVQIERDGGENEAMELARRHYQERNLVTRTLAEFCIGRPVPEKIILQSFAFAAQRAPRSLALKVCSILFNLRYLQGMSVELGGRQALWSSIKFPHPERTA